MDKNSDFTKLGIKMNTLEKNVGKITNLQNSEFV